MEPRKKPYGNERDDEKTHLHEIDFVWNFNTSNYLNINHSPLIGLLEIIHTQEPHSIPEIMYTTLEYRTQHQNSLMALLTCDLNMVRRES